MRQKKSTKKKISLVFDKLIFLREYLIVFKEVTNSNSQNLEEIFKKFENLKDIKSIIDIENISFYGLDLFLLYVIDFLQESEIILEGYLKKTKNQRKSTNLIELTIIVYFFLFY